MKLSPNFSLIEFTRSQTAERNDIDNAPGDAEIAALKALCENVLQPARDHFGRSIQVTSGYRGEELERVLTANSYKNWCRKHGKEVNEDSWQEYFARKSHPKGQAADIVINGLPHPELALWLEANVDFDQLILEFYDPDKPEKGWVHVSYASAETNRRQTLTIGKGGTQLGLKP